MMRSPNNKVKIPRWYKNRIQRDDNELVRIVF